MEFPTDGAPRPKIKLWMLIVGAFGLDLLQHLKLPPRLVRAGPICRPVPQTAPNS